MAPPTEGARVSDTDGVSYVVGKVIGSGSFGSVFRAARTDDTGAPHWPRDFALKWQRRTPGAQTEAYLHRQLVHRCVVRCLAAWDDSDGTYAVLEYCAHGSLLVLIDWCVRNREAGNGNALLESAGSGLRDHFSRLLSDMVDAVAYCGRMGVVHCDIKPENILVDSELTFKLSDFGLSSVTAQRSDYATAERARGTPSYMAPEVFAAYERDDRVQLSAWTDAYSLGLTLLQALRLSTRPVLGGKEDARRFHEIRRNVEVQDREHPSDHVPRALRMMLRHDKEARLSALGVLQMLQDGGAFEVSTTQSVGSLFDRVQVKVRTRATTATAAKTNVAERQLRHAGARLFWAELHDVNATQWDWQNFADCLFAQWSALESHADLLRELLVPAGRSDVPMARLSAVVAKHPTLSLGDALARELGVRATTQEATSFARALRAFHFAPFEFRRARTLFNKVLADDDTTATEKARAHLSLYVLYSWEWGGETLIDTTSHKVAASAGASLLLHAGDEGDRGVREFEMGFCHYYGIGTKEDNDKAFSLFCKSAGRGCAAAMVFLGECLFYGHGVAENRPAAVAQYRKAAVLGHFGGLSAYGNCLYKGWGVHRDAEGGVAMIRRAALKGENGWAKNWLETKKDALVQEGLWRDDRE